MKKMMHTQQPTTDNFFIFHISIFMSFDAFQIYKSPLKRFPLNSLWLESKGRKVEKNEKYFLISSRSPLNHLTNSDRFIVITNILAIVKKFLLTKVTIRIVFTHKIKGGIQEEKHSQQTTKKALYSMFSYMYLKLQLCCLVYVSFVDST